MKGFISFVRAAQVTGILTVCLVLAGCSGSKINKGNYDRIKDGMSLKEVEDILGKGEEQASVNTGGTVDIPGQNVGGISVPGQKVEMPKMSGKNYVWKDSTKIITITFINDRMTAKAQAGL